MMIENVWRDIRYGARSLARQPGFTAAALATLALGIGATSAVFTVVHSVLLESLPYPEPERLVLVTGTHTEGGQVDPWPISYPDFADWRGESAIFQDLAACSNLGSFNLRQGETVERIRGELVSAGYFRAFGIQPLMGRTFRDDEDAAGVPHRVAVVSHGFWQRRYGSDRGLLGRSLEINGLDFTVVGVMLPGFQGLTDQAEIWMPLTLVDTLSGHGSDYLENRMARWLSLVGRLREGVSVERSQEVLDAWSAGLAEEYPDTNEGHGARVKGLREAFFGDLRGPLLALLASVAFVLLIACVNVANLLLARGARRQQETALRTVIGAQRHRLVAQHLVESLVLALAGAVLGLVVAALGTRALVGLAAVDLKSFVDFGLDPVVVGVITLAALLCGLGFGVMPARFASRADHAQMLREGERSSTPGRHRFQKGLIVGEVALALLLLVAAGLMIQSFNNLRQRDLGFRADEVLVARFDLKEERYTEDAPRNVLLRELLAGARALPGVAAATLVGPGIPTDDWHGLYFLLDGRTDTTEDVPVLLPYHAVTPGYFSLLGVPLVAGRDFTAGDDASAPEAIIVSRALAERYWPGRDPIGQRLRNGPRDSDDPWLRVVGVVGDVQNQGLIGELRPGPDVYLPVFQSPPMTTPTYAFLLRPEGVPAASLAAPLRESVARVAPSLPLFGISELEEHLETQAANDRFLAIVMSLFAGLALVLAAVGLYGVIAYSVAQRRREIGVRLALGAPRREVLTMVLRQAMTLVVAGAVAGVVTSLALVRLLTSLLHDIGAYDVMTLAFATAFLLLVGLLASFLPAHAATRVEPVAAIAQPGR